MSNKIIIGGPLIPSINDCPIDDRTRVADVQDIYNIESPFKGMIIYVINENRYYKVTELKSKTIGSTEIPNSAIKKYERLMIADFQGELSLNRTNGSTVGEYSSTLGQWCAATGKGSHAEGCITKANGEYSHAEGNETVADGGCSHVEGGFSKATGHYSHAEGYYTTASEFCSHAEGSHSQANGEYSHAEGYETQAIGEMSHAEGCEAIANDENSHAEGYYTIASGREQHVQGRANIKDTEKKYAHIVGNGTSSKRSNAHTLDWDGNAWFQGDVFIKGTSQDDGQKLATEDMVIALQQEIAELRAIIDELKNK